MNSRAGNSTLVGEWHETLSEVKYPEERGAAMTETLNKNPILSLALLTIFLIWRSESGSVAHHYA